MFTKMHLSLLLGSLLCVLLPSALSDQVSFEGYRVFTIRLPKEEIPLLQKLEAIVPLDYWKEPARVTNPRSRMRPFYEADIMVAPEHISTVETFLANHGLPHQIKLNNVEEILAEERHIQEEALRGPRALNWEAYHRYDVILDWVEQIARENSDIASVITIGTSTEGRQLKMVKISKPNSPENKTAVLIDGGFHAREWIAPAVVTYVLNQLLANRTAHTEVLDAVDLYIIPVINPDGYEYTHTTNRMWRKTRRDHDSPLGCVGVDPNRNFDFHFGGAGTSTNKCSDLYTGPNPFSEPETAALQAVLLNNNTINFQSYLTVHSYGQWWLTPWSWDYGLPEDYDDLMRFGNHGANALTAVHGTRYIVDATTEILGPTAGCSDDWAKAVAGIKYANTLELRDTGRYGFALPASQIKATAEETWAGIRAVLLYDFVNHRPRS